ncbi:bifunctional adenosylcobinamide kinase/adenosylcobinamide-phosphate guanylyltransferase [Roseovarius rhodophyticola]|uniref:Bifunctional adenosylcobalamin biosynthesis protein n=1 Tax=Roseovarius rhodophyticola TaxID=3080827 RepID=A0ABZ2TAK7_9RHOB|nr:bifunctional adenosylcobinamide kinase/adenosylcobinamide-phosphate guanylyltransferase [Roseovarius sp. W115]MDV2930396.1 bifunctional adenosylcobinamide kinase/adenosylcobinamide-phosphate guanylyltransferase [Roseovarius sp. W115]
MLPGLSLVIGGAASGKSAVAEGLVKGTGRNLVYLATAQAHDAEMRAKLRKHKEQRGEGWRTIEEPLDIGRTLATISGDNAVLLDCLTMWLSNQMLAENPLDEAEAELMAGLALCPAPLVIVTNEVGLSVVPENALARQFREAQGRLNQKIAAKADLVVNVVAGLPQVLKGTLP